MYRFTGFLAAWPFAFGQAYLSKPPGKKVFHRPSQRLRLLVFMTAQGSAHTGRPEGFLRTTSARREQDPSGMPVKGHPLRMEFQQE
jgi:hypothetical protein